MQKRHNYYLLVRGVPSLQEKLNDGRSDRCSRGMNLNGDLPQLVVSSQL